MAILLDDVNTVTTKDILPGVTDGYFKAGPLMAMLKARFTRGWIGPQIQTNYLFRPHIGAAYAPGGAFNVQKHQTRSGIQFTPRFYYVNVTEYLEALEVLQAGPRAAFSVIQEDMAEAALTMSAILEIAAFHHGQNIAGSNRLLELNGLEEAFNDGVTASWDGNLFPSYGGQTRTDVAPALTPPTGLISSPNIAGPISYRVLRHTYYSCRIGQQHPEIGLTTKRCMGFISENFLPQQVIDTTQPEIGWPGLKFDRATIMDSDYCPGRDGVNDTFLGNYNASAGETFWWLNFGPTGEKANILLHIAQSAKFRFGFTGFKGAREDNQVSGQILFGGNLTARALRLSRVLHGITS
jgi:hypothetical protein